MEPQDFKSGAIQPENQTFHQWNYVSQNYEPIRSEYFTNLVDNRHFMTEDATVVVCDKEIIDSRMSEHQFAVVLHGDSCRQFRSTAGYSRDTTGLRST